MGNKTVSIKMEFKFRERLDEKLRGGGRGDPPHK